MEKQVKKLSGIKLNQLNMTELEQRKMNMLRGGSECGCKNCYCAGTNSGVNTAAGPQVGGTVLIEDGGGSYEE